MKLHEEQLGDLTVVSLEGQVDSLTASELETGLMAVLDRGVKELLLDCGGLGYINSAGLRVFLLVAKRLEQEKGRLGFCALSSNVHLIFSTIGFDRILTIYATREEALAKMQSLTSKAA